MKLKAIPMLLVGAISLTAITAPLAEARGRYYRTSEITCNRDAGGAAVAGAILGGVLGGIIGSGSNDTGEGIAIGAAAGGMLGLGLNCREEVEYYRNADDYLGRRDFDRRYEWNNGYFEYDRTEYLSNGSECYVYRSVVYTRRGTKSKTEVSCYSRRGWEHGYSEVEFDRHHKHKKKKKHKNRDRN